MSIKTNIRKVSFLFIICLCLSFTALLISCAENGSAGVVSCTTKPSESVKPSLDEEAKNVKNVIVCIGDGMGLGQVAATRMSKVGIDGKLNMEKFPIAGLMRTHSADSFVTDSAASGTAMACGIKTDNGMVGPPKNYLMFRGIIY